MLIKIGIEQMKKRRFFMSFNPELEIGKILKNSDIVKIFRCGNMGGMRRSRTTNTLVIVYDYTYRKDNPLSTR